MLSLELDVSGGALCRKGWGVGGGGWSWRRSLFTWDELVEGCVMLFYEILLFCKIIYLTDSFEGEGICFQSRVPIRF
jgi:hypothetical protein